MIFLDSSTNLTVELAATVVANQAKCYASWRDTKTGELSPGFTSADTNNTSAVNAVPAPASTYIRGVDYLTVFNEDTGGIVVTVTVGTRKLIKAPLATGEALVYTDSAGWYVLSSAGTVKSSVNQIAGPANDGFSIVVLSADVTNNNAVANTIQDVTGLSFSMANTKLYEFEFTCLYTSAATTTGSRWSINATPSAEFVVYNSEYALAAATVTSNPNLRAFDSPATSTASSSSATEIMRAKIQGLVRANADATLIARFASEVANSAIVCKAGSFVKYRQID